MSAVGTAVLIVSFWLNNDRAKRAGLLILIAAALVSLPVFVSGEISGGQSSLTGAFAAALEQHKAAARPAFLAISAAGIAALVGLILGVRRSKFARIGISVALIFGVAATLMVIRATYIGRQIKWAENEAPSVSGTTPHFDVSEKRDKSKKITGRINYGTRK